MTGQLIPFPRRTDHDPELTYAQLAALWQVSKRFLQLMVAEGMPHEGVDYGGRRVVLLSKVTSWMEARQERLGRTMRDVRSPLPREAS